MYLLECYLEVPLNNISSYIDSAFLTELVTLHDQYYIISKLKPILVDVHA